MDIWTKENILDYLSHPEESLDKNYTKRNLSEVDFRLRVHFSAIKVDI